jgi:hypothetical protein
MQDAVRSLVSQLAASMMGLSELVTENHRVADLLESLQRRRTRSRGVEAGGVAAQRYTLYLLPGTWSNWN